MICAEQKSVFDGLMWIWRCSHHKFTTPLNLKLSVKLIVFIGLLPPKLPKKKNCQFRYALNSQNYFQPKLLRYPSLWLSHLIISLKSTFHLRKQQKQILKIKVGLINANYPFFTLFTRTYTLSHQPQPLHIHDDHQGITHILEGGVCLSSCFGCKNGFNFSYYGERAWPPLFYIFILTIFFAILIVDSLAHCL